MDNDINWTKQNHREFSQQGRNLVIDNVNRLNSGTYVCTVMIQLIPTIGLPVNVTGITHVKVDVLCKYFFLKCGISYLKFGLFPIMFVVFITYIIYSYRFHVYVG